MSEENENQELSDEQIDSLVEETDESTNREIPMTKEDAAPKVEASPDKTQAEIYAEFTHNGKQVKATRDQLLKWAQQGYDYPQRMAQFNKQRQEFEKQQQEYQAKYQPYEQINEWATKNPDQWARIQQAYQQAQAQPQTVPGVAPELAPVLSKYEQEIQSIKQFMSGLQQKEQQAIVQAEDSKLEQEMKSIRETYKDLDFDTPDEEGKSLEFRVLEYAKENGIRKYTTAFRDFNHDRLVARAETLAKQNLSKTIQTNSKNGVLGKSPTTMKQVQSPKNLQQKSYDDLANEALAEYQAGLY